MSGLWPNGSYTIPRVTSEFGPRVSPGGIGSTNHLGIDLRAGLNLKAAEAGLVIFSGYNGGSGNEVRIKGDSGREFRYKHCSLRLVRAGVRVSAGQHIANEGATGAVTGPHVHFETLVNGTQVNPRTQMGAPAITPSSSGKFSQDVYNRQVFLNTRGAGLALDGLLGPRTRAAIAAFQRAYGLVADGIWGPKTTELHTRLVTPPPAPAPAPAPTGGSTSLREVQQALKTKYPAYAGRLVVDGIDGPQTRAAVREFQRRSGLVQDGIAGPKTRRALGL